MITAPILHKTIHKAMDWLYELEDLCGWDDHEQRLTLAILRATLHELRDLMPLENMASLSAQFPLFIRGLFFENWRPHNNPSRERTKEDFLEGIRSQLVWQHYSDNFEDIVKKTLKVILSKIDPKEAEKVKKIIHRNIAPLFS